MPRYSSDLNKYVRGDDVTPVASASRSASGDSGWLNGEDIRSLALTLNITAFAMTDLDVKVQEASDSSGTNARDVGAFTQATATGSERKSFAITDKFYKVVWAKTGGTTATFSVAGISK